MDRPKITKFNLPKTLMEIPFSIAKPGGLLQTNAGFRSMKPILNNDKCVKCMMCYVLCPEGTVYKEDDKLVIDYDFCKGCGICARECKPKAIEMIPEGEQND